MNTPPTDLDEADLVTSLLEAWGFDVVSFAYVPKGFGSHHWAAVTSDKSRHFVTVDDLDAKPWFGAEREVALSGLTAALTTAHELRDQCGLPFVIAPEPTRNGDVLQRVGPRYTVSVFRWVEGAAGCWGDALNKVQHLALSSLLVDLHEARPAPLVAPTHSPELPDRRVLEEALEHLHRPWSGGPYSEPARTKFLERHADLLDSLAKLDRLSVEVRASPVVLTHGEPHPGNMIWVNGRPALVDWDTVGLAPRERDLWMLDDLAAYEERTGAAVSEKALAFYRLRWQLADVAAYAVMFRSPHERNADTDKAWTGLADYLGASGPLGRGQPWTLGLSRPSVETMTTDHLTAEQKRISGFFPGDFDARGWGTA